MKRITIYLIVSLCFIAHARQVDAGDSPRHVRVAVLKEVKEFTISVRGKYQILDLLTSEELGKGRRFKKAKVKAFARGIQMGDTQYQTKYIRIKTNKDAALYRGQKKYRYRKQIDIILKSNNEFLVINTVDLEAYVKGVLYHEVPHYWPLNAIKAQAVATRTYAMYQLEQRVKEKFDVTSDIYSQVYGGRSAERHRTNIAANRTRGQILSFQGKVLPAYFHSTCGGKTENVAELWKHDLRPLKGVTCGFCTRSPHYRWKKNFRSKDVQDKLNEQGFKLGLIKELKVIKRSDSGRVKTLRITTRDGKKKTISGVRFREIIGPNHLKSHHFDIEMQGYFFDVIGRGWGHGVGMCQWGAYQMSKERYKYTMILEHYYPGAVITKITE